MENTVDSSKVKMEDGVCLSDTDTVTNDKANGIPFQSNEDSEMQVVVESSSTCEEKENDIVSSVTNCPKDDKNESVEEIVNGFNPIESTVTEEKDVSMIDQDSSELAIVAETEKISEDVFVINSVSECAKENVSSLGAIALEYENSDSEAEDNSTTVKDKGNGDNVTMKEIEKQPYRENPQESQCSDDSDSEDDSSSSISSLSAESDDSDSDDGAQKKKEGSNIRGQKENKMKSELDDLPPIEELKISVPEVLCDPMGQIGWMVEQLVIVQPKPGKPTLNLDTVLFIEKGKRVLGRVFDVFGQVSEPHYCVRFNSSEHIKECDIKVGMTVYYCPNTPYTTLVFVHELTKMKGSDAVDDDEPVFSDDEEERAYYENLRKEQANNASNKDVPNKKMRSSSPSGWKSNHPWNRNTQKHKKDGQFGKRNNRQSNAMQPYSNWPPTFYQNNWYPRYPYPTPDQQCGYRFQSAQYANDSTNNPYPSPHNPQESYEMESGAVPPNPRIPFHARPRFPPGYPPFGHNRPNAPPPNMRFRHPDPYWQSQSQMSARASTPWVSLPPPPPPPPPPSGSS